MGGNNVVAVVVVELLLRFMVNGDGEGLPSEFHALGTDNVWRVLTLPSVLEGWFVAWFVRQAPGFTKRIKYEQLLYPAFVLGGCPTFASVTKWQTYNMVGQISEENPPVRDGDTPSRRYKDIHLPKGVIRRGTLRG
ncbi:hypothetical protein F4802DRAFT_597970 [Xylaria palmicola]|nr:hypothetical protein F4802DRAFT_597970 [Xylaria palmicola]